ncbi:MAG: hypothetical protein AB1633_01710 [Elusimicrobiota bacterium]
MNEFPCVNRAQYYILPLIIYLVFGTGILLSQKPDEDETPHTNASYNLANYGFMGITVWDSRGENIENKLKNKYDLIYKGKIYEVYSRRKRGQGEKVAERVI